MDTVSRVIVIALLTGLLTALIMLGLSLFLAAFARPRGATLVSLTSSMPGEVLLEYRVCNARIANAEPNALWSLGMSAIGSDETGAEEMLALIKKLMGGLWVGGRVFVTSHRVVFLPNLLNRALHKSLPRIAFKLSAITRVRDRFGVVTRIVEVETPGGTLTVRGYKMREFAGTVERARLLVAEDDAIT